MCDGRQRTDHSVHVALDRLREETEGRVKVLLRILPWLFVALFGAEIVAVLMPKPDGEFHVREFGRLPVLMNGRIQPFDSVARNSLLQIRSTADVPLEEVPWWKFWHHPKKLKSTAWLLEVMFRPEQADKRPIFLIHHPELLSELELQDKGVTNSALRYYTFDQLAPVLRVIWDQGMQARKVQEESQRTPFQKQVVKLQNAVFLYQNLKGAVRPQEWEDFAKELNEFEASMATAYSQNNPGQFNRAVEDYKGWLADKFGTELKKGRQEFFYNDAKAFLHAMIIYVCAFVLAGISLLACSLAPALSESLRRSAFYLILLAGVVHTFGLGFRMYLEGRPPVTNLYSSAIFIGWGAMILGVVLERIYRLGIGNVVAACAGFVTLLIAHNLALGGDTMEMLRAVLDTNFWLATHVVIVTLGYASTFVAGLLAVTYIFLGVFTPILRQKLTARGAAVISAATGVVGGVHA